MFSLMDWENYMNIFFLIPLTLSAIILLISCRVSEEVEQLSARLIAIIGLLLSLIFTPMWLKGILLLWLLKSYRHPLIKS